MTKDSLANIIFSRARPWTKTAARGIVGAIFRKFISDLVKDGRLRIDGLGEFKVKTKAARRCHNPQTGEVVMLPEKQIIKFYPAGVLKELVQKQ